MHKLLPAGANMSFCEVHPVFVIRRQALWALVMK